MNNKSTKDLGLSSNERLFLKNKSIFAPNKYANLKPYGFKIYTFHAGFKKRFDDLLIIIFDKFVKSKIIYSKTSTPSAPIIWGKKYNRGKLRALIVNSGNANAHTGKKGIKIIDEYVAFLSNFIKCKKNEILVSSTGVIGELFEPKKIIRRIASIEKSNPKKLLDAAKAIMTTDTYPKISFRKISLGKKSFNIYGFAKGSGMINPNMGTMLVYIFIEADISKKIMNKLLKLNIDNTFNAISVDGDTSTSDTLALFSIDRKQINFNLNRNFAVLNRSLNLLMHDLSMKIIKDGEGLTKLIKLNVLNCKSKKQADNISSSVINSPLVKTAISGEDANWGRIIAAIGKSEEKINQNKIKIMFGKYIVCQKGAIYKKINDIKIKKYMKNKIIEITIKLNNGRFGRTVYGNDLSYEYIRINADYRS